MKPGAWLPHSSWYSAETDSRRLLTVIGFPMASEHVSGHLSSLTGSRSRTGLARLVPGFPYVVGAAAHLLGHVEGQLVLTGVVEVAVAHALPHVCIKTQPIPSVQKLTPKNVFSNCAFAF